MRLWRVHIGTLGFRPVVLAKSLSAEGRSTVTAQHCFVILFRAVGARHCDGGRTLENVAAVLPRFVALAAVGFAPPVQTDQRDG
jgi:hypothetical protein